MTSLEKQIRIVSLAEYREFMDEHWLFLKDQASLRRHWLPIKHSNFRWKGSEYFSRMVVFPIGIFIEGRLVGATLVYAISSTALCLNGLYVLGQYRGLKLVDQMIDFALGLWPDQWTFCVGLFRDHTLDLFAKKGWHAAPGWALRDCYYRDSLLSYKVVLLQRDRNFGHDRNKRNSHSAQESRF